MTSDDKIPGLVALFISVLVCFPCTFCAGCYALTGLAVMLDPELVAEAQLAETYSSSVWGAVSLTCSGTAIIALVGGIILLIWGIRRLSGKLV